MRALALLLVVACSCATARADRARACAECVADWECGAACGTEGDR